MVASSLLVLTTGRQYCERFIPRLPVKIVECPMTLPRLMYYQLWHERTHSSSSARWLRETTKSVAASLRPPPGSGVVAADKKNPSTTPTSPTKV